MKKNIRSIILIIKKLNYVLNRDQKIGGIKVAIAICVGAFLELLGVSAVLPFVQAVTNPEELVNKHYIKVLTNILKITSTNDLMIMLGIVLIFIYILKNLFMIFVYYIQFDYSTKVSRELSIKMLKSFMMRPYEFFLDINSAQVLRGCTNDTNGIYAILYNLISLITELLTVIGIGLYLIYTDAVVAFSVIILMVIVLIGMVGVFKPIYKKIGKKYLDIATQKSKTIYQITSGIKEIYVTQTKEAFCEKYAEAVNEERKINRIKETMSASPDRITEGICVSGIIGIICVRLLLNDDTIMMFIPKLAAFAMAAFKIFPSIGKITSRVNAIVFQIPALENVYHNLKQADEYKKEQNKYIELHNTPYKEKIHFNDKLIISHVSWVYKKQVKETLSDVNFSVKKGESIGVIGSSGSGKTTLSDIILGLLQPKRGFVYMDGIDIYTIPMEWARIVSYVPQTVFLLDDTVKNNVLFGEKITVGEEEEIWEALRQAQLEEFVKSLPNKLETVVGERGVKFSGGQRQRIAIARALYRKPEILVLDEATAALDNETETAVMEAVESLQGKVTMIIVAHRLSTIKNCDVIYEIENGIATRKEKNEVLKEK